mmetsp:Transcript_28956/g.93006  ORF Transcript_28956/g.93006 Transcript_28956/m.93006 type:complete len:320 (+) Transcript_28956:317-1276(+)
MHTCISITLVFNVVQVTQPGHGRDTSAPGDTAKLHARLLHHWPFLCICSITRATARKRLGTASSSTAACDVTLEQCWSCCACCKAEVSTAVFGADDGLGFHDSCCAAALWCLQGAFPFQGGSGCTSSLILFSTVAMTFLNWSCSFSFWNFSVALATASVEVVDLTCPEWATASGGKPLLALAELCQASSWDLRDTLFLHACGSNDLLLLLLLRLLLLQLLHRSRPCTLCGRGGCRGEAMSRRAPDYDWAALSTAGCRRGDASLTAATAVCTTGTGLPEREASAGGPRGLTSTLRRVAARGSDMPTIGLTGPSTGASSSE